MSGAHERPHEVSPAPPRGVMLCRGRRKGARHATSYDPQPAAAVADPAPRCAGAGGDARRRPRAGGADPGAAVPFFLTHYELLGDPAHPSGVRYSSTGTPFAKARDGSSITFTGQGAWDPANRRAIGAGTYVIRNRRGAVRERGTWRARRFVSFLQLPGWWGIKNFREEGWQGPPGSASFSGFLKLRVTLTGHGSGVLRLWCLMPTVPKPDGHASDGLSFRGRGLRFTDFRQQEKRLEGVMFYSR